MWYGVGAALLAWLGMLGWQCYEFCRVVTLMESRDGRRPNHDERQRYLRLLRVSVIWPMYVTGIVAMGIVCWIDASVWASYITALAFVIGYGLFVLASRPLIYRLRR